MDKNKINWNLLSKKAWNVKKSAFIFGKTRVGASILSSNNKYYSGCNVEHIYRSHDIHAEVNAIGNMISGGDKKIIAILIVAERKFFTPCGGCMDWIMQFGSKECIIGFQNKKGGKIMTFLAEELMPHYPS